MYFTLPIKGLTVGSGMKKNISNRKHSLIEEYYQNTTTVISMY